MVLASLSALIIACFSSYCSSKASTGFGREIRRAIFLKVESLSQSDIDKIGTPSLITRSTNDVKQVQEMVLIVLKMIVSSIIMMIGGTIMAFVINKRLSITLFIVLPVLLLIAYLIAKKIIPLYKVVQEKTDKLNQIIREKLSGIRVIKAFNREKYEDERFNVANYDLTSLMLKINRIYAGLIPMAIMLLFSLIVLLVYLNSKQMISLDVATHAQQIADTVGDLQAFVMYVLMIIFAVSMAASMYVILPKAMICANRINEVFNLEPQILDPEVEKKSDSTGKVVFENVSFGYPGAEKYVLSDISFEANPGEVTAIIGGTGSGKSTMINLIPRFYDVSKGKILIDSVDVRDMKQSTLHEKIGIIPQQALLFSGTISDNIKFGKQDATNDEINRALEISQAKEFVDNIQDGINSIVSQGGKNFSGGQKQRLAITRALIKDAEVFIFDDSFSALDFLTDAKLKKALKENLKNATIIIVAQRIGTILDADKIIVLDEGKIAGIGTHKELAKNCTVYKEIMESQYSQEDFA